jgi:DNA-directed RNA polymerase beta' subunit
LKPEDCIRIFSAITDEDCDLMGLNPKVSRPEWMVISKLAVAPPPVRPSVAMSTTSRSEDDLTYAY